MSKSACLRTLDIRAIHRLTCECRDLGDDPFAWRHHLLAGLARLTGAGVTVDYEGTFEPFHIIGTAGYGWENGYDFQAWLRMNEAFARHGLTFNPMFGAFMAAVRRGLGPCLSRAQLVRDRAWYRSEYYRDYHSEAGGDAMLYCINNLPRGDAQVSGLALVRALGERDFSPRDRAIVLEAHKVVAAWVGGPLARFDEPTPAGLPPRLRQVLRCLLEGDSDKLTAKRLRLSRFTVNEHVKRLYSHFGVATRGELLARWIRRGWGGQFPWADRETGGM